ncbi:uncharacterized protein ACA1_077750 [Acanthamoeba castellanii str. Neff]|uniref:Secreted protein n=1 Tax=Acanthamoeba castellanii (strain ATCC 30010 / Neff) TaxID=1257118 RepID=L8GNR3_ACACF|nr:uncharacterized protein ACA1_077750 [Acanthamoeba castellanii str. Neff]ELR14544.1 hypothetical protein ACA1_077750 [Acanthamoeba castellanii str. Neff]
MKRHSAATCMGLCLTPRTSATPSVCTPCSHERQPPACTWSMMQQQLTHFRHSLRATLTINSTTFMDSIPTRSSL